MPFKGTLARSTLRTTGVLIARLLLQAVTLVLLAKLLGPADFGLYAGVAALAALFGMLATAGTHFALLNKTSLAAQDGGAVFAYAIPTTLVVGTALVGVLLMAAVLFSVRAPLPLYVIALIGLTEIVFTPIVGLLNTEHLARERTALSQTLQAMPLAIRLAALGAIIWAASEDPIIAYAWACLGAAVFSAFVSAAIVRSSLPALSKWRRPSRNELRDALPFAVVNATAVGPSEIDKTLAAKLLPATEAGLYAAAARILGAAALPVVALMLSALPRLFRTSGTNVDMTKLVLPLFLASTAYGVALGVAVWVAAPFADTLFGREFLGISGALTMLCLVPPALATRLTAGHVLMSTNSAWFRVGSELVGMAMLAVAAFAVAPGSGLKGMAVALTASEWTMAVVGIALVAKTTRKSRGPPVTFDTV